MKQKRKNILIALLITISIFTELVYSKKITVTTATQFKNSVTALQPGDTLEVANGNYDLNSYLNITQSGTPELPIVIKAQNNGGAILINKSFFDLKQVSYVIIEGFDFRGKDGTVIKMESCNYVRITKNYFRLTETTSQKWIIIGGTYDKPELTSSYNRIDHNYFENKTQPGNFITVDGTPSPTYIPSKNDLIDHNHFKNSSPRVTNEKESVRLGQSNFSASSAYTVVEYNLFEDCDGDPEFLSVKTCNDTVRYNTFLNSMGTLCLRQGKGSAAYNNYFIGNGKEGTGGIRVYSSDHKIFNNYMINLTGDTWDAAITITNGDVENTSTSMSSHFRPENLFIGYNSIINCQHSLQIGYTNNGSYTKPPRNIAFANNLITGGSNELVKILTAPVSFNYISNVMFPFDTATIGLQLSDTEIRNINPLLAEENGLMKITKSSPLINSGKNEYSFVVNDMDGQLRDGMPDIGADEYSAAPIKIKPLTAKDVGPLSEVLTTGVKNKNEVKLNTFILFPAYPNPFNPSVNIEFYIEKDEYVQLGIYDVLGKKVVSLLCENIKAGMHKINLSAEDYKLASGIYYCAMTINNSSKYQKLVLIK